MIGNDFWSTSSNFFASPFALEYVKTGDTFAFNLLSLFNTDLQSLYLETHFQQSSKANFLNSLYKNCSLLKKQLKTKERIYHSKEL